MATYYDADLLLKLYDLRREERMRKARAFLIGQFSAKNLEEFYSKYPRQSDEAALFRQVTTYWEMAASLVNNGALDEKLFFENASEHFAVWERIKHLVPEVRADRKNPLVFKNLESVAARYEKWLASQAPEAVEGIRKMLAAISR
ncbi:MAG TPA: DUF4760 domain-containing protein [Acidobacteriota bacterium]|jgi:hypothetical protein|nr:DUF4760 domain-containing protein [Acidobacteriota bacterium]